MGFWDDKVDNPIDRMFDFDRDGELNSTEKAMELDFLSGGNSSNISINGDDLYQDLSFTGITKDEFELMDDDEKREALEDAGIDVDDYDDVFISHIPFLFNPNIFHQQHLNQSYSNFFCLFYFL